MIENKFDRVIIVDDNEDEIIGLEKHFEEKGIFVKYFEYKDSLKKSDLCKFNSDAIFLDVNLNNITTMSKEKHSINVLRDITKKFNQPYLLFVWSMSVNQAVFLDEYEKVENKAFTVIFLDKSEFFDYSEGLYSPIASFDILLDVKINFEFKKKDISFGLFKLWKINQIQFSNFLYKFMNLCGNDEERLESFSYSMLKVKGYSDKNINIRNLMGVLPKVSYNVVSESDYSSTYDKTIIKDTYKLTDYDKARLNSIVNSHHKNHIIYYPGNIYKKGLRLNQNQITPYLNCKVEDSEKELKILRDYIRINKNEYIYSKMIITPFCDFSNKGKSNRHFTIDVLLLSSNFSKKLKIKKGSLYPLGSIEVSNIGFFNVYFDLLSFNSYIHGEIRFAKKDWLLTLSKETVNDVQQKLSQYLGRIGNSFS